MGTVYTLGIDVGSTSSKCLILKDGNEITARSLTDAGAGTSGPERALNAIFAEAGMTIDDMDYILATGYGRNSLMDIADKQMSELSCHARGASYLFPDVHTVIDIGGQDAKVIRTADGLMTDFQMNDKCAAGTGRFLEVMARVLEVDISELAALGGMSSKRVDISSTCTVFAESEVISQLASGADKCDIIAGIHRSVAQRIAGLVYRVGLEESVAMTGGVALNSGVVKALEDELGVSISVSSLAQYNGALGAALLAYQAVLSK